MKEDSKTSIVASVMLVAMVLLAAVFTAILATNQKKYNELQKEYEAYQADVVSDYEYTEQHKNDPISAYTYLKTAKERLINGYSMAEGTPFDVDVLITTKYEQGEIYTHAYLFTFYSSDSTMKVLYQVWFRTSDNMFLDDDWYTIT